ncbi:non-structural silencing protein [Bean necrotic mosaic virus]|uniref:Non-structural silencing protein n=1 Tax=Bean necrotic mosaic virus TaxID=1033976 RepID=I3PCT0_9VIRU|nr:non-structural silencing protein [Bean necrotic mosaic virus]AER23987.1 non-structural silencing protein [Bean necrotic mosaic virus]
MQTLVNLGKEFGSQVNQKHVIDTYWVKTKFSGSNNFGSNYVQMYSDEDIQTGFRFNEPGMEIISDVPDVLQKDSSVEVFSDLGVSFVFDAEKVTIKISHGSVNKLGVKHKGHLKVLEFEDPNVIEGTVDRNLVASVPGINNDDIEIKNETINALPSMNMIHLKEDSYKITKSPNCFFGKRNMLRRGWIGTGYVTNIHPIGYVLPKATNRCLGTLSLKSMESTVEKGVLSSDIAHAELSLGGKCNFHLFSSCKGDLGDVSFMRNVKFFEDKHERVFTIYVKTSSDIDNNKSSILVIFKTVCYSESKEGTVSVSSDDKLQGSINLSELPESGFFDHKAKSMLIVQSLIKIHNEFASKISEKLNKSVIVYTLRSVDSFKKEITEIDSRAMNYLISPEGEVFFLSRTFQESLPTNMSSLTYFFDLQTFGWSANYLSGDLVVRK